MANSGPGARRKPTPNARETTDVIVKRVLSFMGRGPFSITPAGSGAAMAQRVPAASLPKTVVRLAAGKQAGELVLQELPHFASGIAVGKFSHDQQLSRIGGVTVDLVPRCAN